MEYIYAAQQEKHKAVVELDVCRGELLLSVVCCGDNTYMLVAVSERLHDE